jgi:hypothetical protein
LAQLDIFRVANIPLIRNASQALVMPHRFQKICQQLFAAFCFAPDHNRLILLGVVITRGGPALGQAVNENHRLRSLDSLLLTAQVITSICFKSGFVLWINEVD